MIVRRYTSDSESDHLDVCIPDGELIRFQIENRGIYAAIELSYEEAEDLRNCLYDFCKLIAPVKKNGA